MVQSQGNDEVRRRCEQAVDVDLRDYLSAAPPLDLSDIVAARRRLDDQFSEAESIASVSDVLISEADANVVGDTRGVPVPHLSAARGRRVLDLDTWRRDGHGQSRLRRGNVL